MESAGKYLLVCVYVCRLLEGGALAHYMLCVLLVANLAKRTCPKSNYAHDRPAILIDWLSRKKMSIKTSEKKV